MTSAAHRYTVGRSPGVLTFLAALSGIVGFMVIYASPAHANPVVTGMQGIDMSRAVVVERDQVVPEVSSVLGEIQVYGVVDGDVDSTVGDISILGPVGGDVESDLGSIRIEAPVGGDIKAGFGDVYINGPVSGSVNADRGDVVLGSDAKVAGDVHCGTGLCRYEEGALVGGRMTAGMINEASSGEEIETAASSFSVAFRWLLGAGLLCGASLLISVLAPAQLASSSRMLESRPVWSMLVGLASLVAAVVFSVLLAVSVIGLPLLILLSPVYLALTAFGIVVAAYFIGKKIVFVIGGYRQGNVLAAAIGAVIVASVGLLPLGGFLLYLVALLGVGASLMALLRGTSLFRKYLPANGVRRG